MGMLFSRCHKKSSGIWLQINVICFTQMYFHENLHKYETNNTKYLQYSYPLGNIVANETIIVHKYIKKNSRSSTRATILHSFAILPCASLSFILVMKVLRIRLISLMSLSIACVCNGE